MISENSNSLNSKTLTIGSPDRNGHPSISVLTIKVPADPPLSIPLNASQVQNDETSMSNHPSAEPGSQARPANKVTLNDFQIITVLGRGSYGEVMMVKKNDTGQQYAMKIIDKNFLSKVNESLIDSWV